MVQIIMRQGKEYFCNTILQEYLKQSVVSETIGYQLKLN